MSETAVTVPTAADAIATLLRGEAAAAASLATEVLRAEPGNADAAHALALARYDLGQKRPAMAALAALLQRYPAHADGWYNLARMQEALGEPAAAMASLERAVALRPDWVQALLDLGRLAEEARRNELAIACSNRVIALAPREHLAFSIRAHALRNLGRLEEALQDSDEILRQLPANKGAHVIRAMLLILLGRTRDALAPLRWVLDRDPGHALARYDHGLALLTLGDLRQGFADYEYRFRGGLRGLLPRGKEETLLRAGEDVAGLRVLLHWEQGFGDTLNFLRYAPMLAAAGASVSLVVQSPLHRLVQRSLAGPRLAVLPQDAPLPPHDRHALLLSAAYWHGTDLASVPAGPPLLRADAVQQARWRQRLALAAAPGTRLRVGFVWAGNPGHPNDRNRSLPLAALLPLMTLPGLQAVSLQKELRDGEAEQLRQAGILVPAAPQDFADTADLIAALDLVVAVDTAVAHLAGGLGVPLLLLLPRRMDWRWLEDGREDTPWYPAARLLRQPRQGDWDSVLHRLGTLLEAALDDAAPWA